ncbi:DUF305 domain-containing protein [bacterium]|nr:DUF305 domain-containing protein [bacterium]
MKIRSVLAFSLTLTIAACGSSGMGGMDMSNDSVSSSVASNADFNSEDVHFSQMMIPHHEQAIEMSDIALDPTVGASDVVKGLATKIKGAQDPEITQMQKWLTDWGKTEMDSSMDMSGMMEGMLSADDLMNLGTLRGTEFDTAWINGMIAHHEGAIKMAEVVITDGSYPEVKTLAEAVISGQQKEIDTMKALLG